MYTKEQTGTVQKDAQPVIRTDVGSKIVQEGEQMLHGKEYQYQGTTGLLGKEQQYTEGTGLHGKEGQYREKESLTDKVKDMTGTHKEREYEKEKRTLW